MPDIRCLLLVCFGLFLATGPGETSSAADEAPAKPAEKPADYQPAGKPITLFDGKSFDGWNGDTKKSFRIEDGAIVGGNLKLKIPNNEFLTHEREFGDFELRFQFKVLGEGVNAGVQFRSRRIPDHFEMIGYQADIGQKYWGALYDESRRRKILAGPNFDELMKHVQVGGWNTYVVRCEGPRIRLSINGFPTVDYTEADPKIEPRGLIGLQIHGGPPSEAWYKDVTVVELRKP